MIMCSWYQRYVLTFLIFINNDCEYFEQKQIYACKIKKYLISSLSFIETLLYIGSLKLVRAPRVKCARRLNRNLVRSLSLRTKYIFSLSYIIRIKTHGFGRLWHDSPPFSLDEFNSMSQLNRISNCSSAWRFFARNSKRRNRNSR